MTSNAGRRRSWSAASSSASGAPCATSSCGRATIDKDVDYLVRGAPARRARGDSLEARPRRLRGEVVRCLQIQDRRRGERYRHRVSANRGVDGTRSPRFRRAVGLEAPRRGGSGEARFHDQRDREEPRRRARSSIPTAAREDIEDRVLRMVFPDAFREDPLRILRGVRFAARFSLRIDEATYEAMKKSAAARRHAQRGADTGGVHQAPRRSASVRAKDFDDAADRCPRARPPRARSGVRRRAERIPHRRRVLALAQELRRGAPGRISSSAGRRFSTTGKGGQETGDPAKKAERRSSFTGTKRSSAEIAREILRRLRYGERFRRAVLASGRESHVPLSHGVEPEHGAAFHPAGGRGEPRGSLRRARGRLSLARARPTSSRTSTDFEARVDGGAPRVGGVQARRTSR